MAMIQPKYILGLVIQSKHVSSLIFFKTKKTIMRLHMLDVLMQIVPAALKASEHME